MNAIAEADVDADPSDLVDWVTIAAAEKRIEAAKAERDAAAANLERSEAALAEAQALPAQLLHAAGRGEEVCDAAILAAVANIQPLEGLVRIRAVVLKEHATPRWRSVTDSARRACDDAHLPVLHAGISLMVAACAQADRARAAHLNSDDFAAAIAEAKRDFDYAVATYVGYVSDRSTLLQGYRIPEWPMNAAQVRKAWEMMESRRPK